MTDIVKLVERLRSRVEWQETPRPIEPKEYRDLIVYGIEQLYALTSRPGLYNPDLLTFEGELPSGYGEVFSVTETEYIILCALIQFFRKVQAMVNARVGYTTDAFSVTNADKPYLHIADTIRELEKDRRTLHYKMPSSMG